MEGNSDLKVICSELDSLALRVLQLMNDLIQCKLNIEKTVKSGSLNLAKARYIMGNRNVSALQLPTEEGAEVSPLVTVLSSNDDTSGLGNLNYSLQRISPQKPPPTSNIIKNRNIESKEEDGEELQPLMGEKSGFQDPLKWFGVLVPQNLRQAQTWFQKAIELSVQCANIQSEINASKLRFKELLKKKVDYIDSVREP